jgi:hypothetical protein
MIVGKGDIASVLVDKGNRTYFCSGVSNSRETRESEYQREKDLLLKQDKYKRLVYFSSLCVFYNDNRYTTHKKEMEQLVKENFKNYTIMRLGNIAWGTNPNTLLNFFRNKIKNNEPLEIWDVWRYVICKEEFLYWIEMIPDWNCEMNIPGVRSKVIDIVNDLRRNNI